MIVVRLYPYSAMLAAIKATLATIPGAIGDEAQARIDGDALVRSEFAAADALEAQARIDGDALVRSEFAAADALEAQARIDGDAAEASVRAAAIEAQDQRSTAIRARLAPDSRRRPGRVREQFVDDDGRTASYIDRDGQTWLYRLAFIDTNYRRPGRLAFGIGDEAGRIGMYVDRDARVGAAGVNLLDSLPARRPARFRFAITDENDFVSLGIDKEGRSHVPGVNLLQVTSGHRRPARFVSGFEDEEGRAIIGIDQEGRTALALNADALTLLADDFGTVDGWRGTENRAFVRTGPSLIRAMMTDADGAIYDAVQLRFGSLTSAVAIASPEIILGIGQSNRGGGSGDPALPTPFQITLNPHHILSLSTPDGSLATDFYGDQTYAFSTFTDVAPSVHRPNYALAPTILHAQARVAVDRRARRRSPPQGLFASWRGSYPAGNFLPGAGYYLYENAIAGVTQLQSNLTRYGLPAAVCRRILWTQGEAGPYPYATVFGEVIDAYVAGVRTALGQSFDPHFYFNQINQDSTSAAASGVEIDQRSVAVARLGSVTCTGPMYQGKMFDQGATDIHVDNIGRMMVAEPEAEAAAIVEAGGTFRALGLTVTMVRTGAQIDITYPNMPGSQLLFDSDIVPDPGSKGFRAYLASDSSPLTINTVEIVGANVVRLTLSADPGGPVRVDYARDTGAALNQWARGRGNLYVEGGPSAFTAYGTPAKVRHYALRMSETTSS